jgi:flagellar P-ring protein precursor FlgI
MLPPGPRRAHQGSGLGAGVRSNQLVGYGLVVGLDGSGDQTTQTPFTVQSIVNMLSNLGVTCRRAPRCS